MSAGYLVDVPGRDVPDPEEQAWWHGAAVHVNNLQTGARLQPAHQEAKHRWQVCPWSSQTK